MTKAHRKTFSFRLFQVAIAPFLIWGQVAYAKNIVRKVSVEEALELAYEANGPANPRKYYDYNRRSDDPFITFQVIGGGEAGSAGFFSVNPWTGDVWALWGCKKLMTPLLRKSQAKIRQRFTAEELKQYKNLSEIKPMCIVEDE